MKLNLDVELNLPEGWEFSGLWYDTYETDETKRWAADADWYQHPEGEPHRRTVMSAEAEGATPQEALERLPGVIQDNLQRAMAMIPPESDEPG